MKCFESTSSSRAWSWAIAFLYFAAVFIDQRNRRHGYKNSWSRVHEHKLIATNVANSTVAVVQQHASKPSGGGQSVPAAKERDKMVISKQHPSSVLSQHQGMKQFKRKRTPGNNPSPPETWSLLDVHDCVKGNIPDVPTNWMKRAPHAILLGVMKSGTSAFSQYIREHPRFVNPALNEMHFFDYNFDEFLTPQGILRQEARTQYAKWFAKETPELLKSNALLALDNSPRYVFWSERIPQRIMCVAPYAKLLMILRDPVTRSYSHYKNRVKDHGSLTKGVKDRGLDSFERWVHDDLKRLRTTGVIRDDVDMDTFAGSQEEQEAWNRYVRTARNQRTIIGRSLYVLQLQQWFKAMDEIGKPRSDMLVIQSEELSTNTESVMSKVWNFLGVQDIKLQDDEKKNVGGYKSAITNKTRQELSKVFAPYNKRLYKILGNEWDGAWDV